MPTRYRSTHRPLTLALGAFDGALEVARWFVSLAFAFEQRARPMPPGLTRGTGRLRRVWVRLAPAAHQLATATGRPKGGDSGPAPSLPRIVPTWIEGSFRLDRCDAAIRELLALGSEVEVLIALMPLRESELSVHRTRQRV